MGLIKGERSIEIDAPVERVWPVVSDVENAGQWMATLKSVTVLERDADGRPTLVETESDAKVKVVRAVLRYTYGPGLISWVQEKGDAKSLVGSWTVTDLGGGRTRATYALESDPGRVLGMLLVGPVQDKVVDMMLGGAVTGLKAKIEG